MYRIAVAVLALVLLAAEGRGELAVVKTVTYSDAVVLLGDKKLLHRRIELISAAGQITIGNFRGLRNGEVLLQDAAAMPLCGVGLVRLSRKTAGPWRRGVGIVGGILAGSLVGGPVALAIAFAGAETVGVATYLAFPVMGGVAGSKLAARREDTIYILDRDSPGAQCEASSRE